MEPDEPALPDRPPADPEEWTHEQWLAWLDATDDDSGEGDTEPPNLRRVTRSSGGSVLGQAMLGMAQAIYGRQQDEIVIVVEGDSDPDEDQPFTVHLVPDHPEQSYVEFRAPEEPAD